MTKYTWTGAGGTQVWDTPANWSPGGFPGTTAADTAVVNLGAVEFTALTKTFAGLTIGAGGTVGVDHVLNDTAANFTVTGTVTNNGGPKNTGGFLIGNSGAAGTSVSIGALNNASANSLTDIQHATVTVTGSITNAGKGVSGTAGLGIGYFTSGELAATVSVGGSVTNSGLLGVGNGSTLDINGALTNTGSATSNGGAFLGKSGTTDSTVTAGSISNGSSASLDISSANVSVSGNVTNSATGSATTTGFGVAYLSANSDVSGTLTVAGAFTNKGNFGIGNIGITSAATANVNALSNASPGQILITGGTTTNLSSLNVTGAGTVTNSGLIDIEHSGDMTIGTLTTIGNLTNSKTIRLDFSNPFSGVGVGSELSISGTLTNTATALGMGIAVDGSSTLMATTINNSGNLFGTGTVTASVNNSGKVFGGSLDSSNVVAPGTLHIDGIYTQSAKGALIEEITSNGGSPSKVDVVGTATLAGALTVNNSGTLTVGTVYTVLTTTDGLTGTFSSIDGVTGQVVTNIGGGTNQGYVVSYTDTDVTLTVVTAGQTDTWNDATGVGANWKTSAKWTSRLPGATNGSVSNYSADSAVINAGGVVDVTDSSDAGTIANLTLGAKTKTLGSGDIELEDGALIVSDNVTNNGTVGIDSTSGSGSTFTDYGTFTNNSNAMAGGGLQIGNNDGDASLTSATFGNLVNGASGSIGIDDASVLVTGNVTNTGNVPGTDGIGVGFGTSSPGGLLQVDGTFTNKGAFAIGNVAVGLADVQVASLANSGTIAIKGNISSSTDFSNLKAETGSNSGKINVADGGSLELGPSFANSGTISLSGSTVPAQLTLDGGGLTLNGGGKIVLATNSAISTAADATNGYTVVDGAAAMDGDEIHVTIANTTLGVNETVTATIDGTTVTKSNSAIAAAIAAAIDGDSTLTGDGITASSVGGLFVIREPGAVGNSTTVTVDDTTGVMGTEAVDPDTLSTLAGGGDPLFTNVNNTISGSGTIGDQYMTLDNMGIIDGNVAGSDLIIDTSANTITNSGTLEAVGGTAGLEISSNLTNTTKGVVYASGSSADVDLEGILVTGGTFKTASGGVILVEGDTIINGVTNTGSLTIDNSHKLELEGATFTNSGNLSISTDGTLVTKLQIDGDIGLAGKGTITLVAGLNDLGEIVSNGSAQVLTNISNTILGAGTIGDTHLTLVNEATIDGNNGSFALTINTGTNTIVNLGILEGTSAFGLTIDSNAVNTKTIEALGNSAVLTIHDAAISNTLGTVLASGTGATIDLEGGTINGGTVQTTGTNAAIDSFSGTNAMNNVTIAAKTVIEDGGGALTITGGSAGAGASVQINSGTIELASASTLNATFEAGGTGSLILDQVGVAPNLSYTGSITGFGGAFHTDTTESIDLKNVAYESSVDTIGNYVANASNTGGVLTIDNTVGSTTTAVAQLTFVGQYSSANFILANDGSGGIKITDPGSSNLADIGLLNNYVAASGGGSSSTSSTPTHTASTQTLDLANSHHA